MLTLSEASLRGPMARFYRAAGIGGTSGSLACLNDAYTLSAASSPLNTGGFLSG
jgi:hypothetical protein